MMPEPDLFATVQPDAKAHLHAAVPDVLPPDAAERLRAVLDQLVGPQPPPTPLTGADIRRACRFCRGRGCLSCETLATAEYARQFPTGPVLLATFARNDPEDLALLRAALAPDALAQGAAEVLRRLAEATTTQTRLRTADREEMP
jgi:hypothetical protein